MLSVGLLGGTGYTGKKLVLFCLQHPKIADFEVYANSSAGKLLWDIFPELNGVVPNKTVRSLSDISMEHSVYFLTLPHGHALQYAPALIANNKKVIDLGGDYRLDSEELYSKWYKIEHTSANLLKTKKYGLADYASDESYDGVSLVANPGCYPTATLLGLLPLVENYSDNILSVSTVAYSGTSGAGKSAKTELLNSEMDGNVRAYNVNEHRHEPEILQMLNQYKFDSPYTFTTHLLPISVGIHATSAIHLKDKIDAGKLNEVYSSAFSESPFVRLRNTPPELKWVVNTNYCDININVKENKIVITSVIDNLIKGAAGQAIQNMNHLFGWDGTLGIINKEVSHASTH